MKATKEQRTLRQALNHAEKTRVELPQVIQVHPSDWDIVILADEVKRLQSRVKELQDATRFLEREAYGL